MPIIENPENTWLKFIHDLKTSLVTTSAGINSVKKYLPTLIEAYKASKPNLRISQEIPERHLAILTKLLENSEKEINNLNLLADVTVAHLKNKPISNS
ncbi:MAG TPA: hypothetical protein VHE99_09930 [Gammaproteobacteria bacterium]|nr:hypothetical protein [Gammaproteobacteria bacterium]